MPTMFHRQVMDTFLKYTPERHCGNTATNLTAPVIARRRRRRSNLTFHRSNNNIRGTRDGIARAVPQAILAVAILPPRHDRDT